MVLWKDVEAELLLPVRFQIPRGYCEYGKSAKYSLVSVDIPDEEFLEWFTSLEKRLLGSLEPIESRVKGNTINLKYVDGFTQVFDETNTFIPEEDSVSFVNSHLDCLVEIDKVYGPMKDTGVYGITCKIFQVRVVSEPCLFVD